MSRIFRIGSILLALFAALMLSGCFVVVDKGRHGHHHRNHPRSKHAHKSSRGSNHGYKSSKGSRSGYRSSKGSNNSYKSKGSKGKKCPPGHVWSDGKCHNKGKGNEKKHY